MFGRAPLLATPRDQKLFVDREVEIERILSNVDQGLSTVVTGPAGSGKTSLLNRVEAELRERPGRPLGTRGTKLLAVRLRYQPQDAREALALLAETLVDEMARAHVRVANQQRAQHVVHQLFEARDVQGQATAGAREMLGILDVLRALGEDLRKADSLAVVIADEAVPPHLTHDLFGRMRDELWAIGAVWLLCLRSADLDRALIPPADTFFERRVSLDPLDRKSARRLVERRLARGSAPPLDPDVFERVIELGRGSPASLVHFAGLAAQGDDLRAAQKRQWDDAQRIRLLSEPAARLLEFIAERPEPTQANDEELHNSFGWSAGRVRQLLGELNDAGLVREAQPRSSGVGRPTKAYVRERAG